MAATGETVDNREVMVKEEVNGNLQNLVMLHLKSNLK